MDLREYLRVIRRHWILLIASVLVGLLVGGLISILSKPTYTSDTQLFVAIQNSGSVQELQQGNTFTQARVQSYVQTATTPVVLRPVIDTLGLTDSPEELAHRVKATSDLNTVLIKISVVDSSPVRASATAQAVADSFMRTVENLERPKNGGESPVSLSIVSPAVAPTSPSSPNTRLNLILGLLAGLVAGIGASLLRGLLDYRIQGEADLRRTTDVPILGGIAFDSNASKAPLLTQTTHQSPRAESFRQLRTNLQFANVTESAKSVLVTSSLPGEGKSTTATNLAIALAQAGQSVCLIDADLRRPVVGEYLGIDRNVGLTTVLVGAVDVHDVLQPWGEDNLFVLASGQIPPNPSELLGSTQMRLLIEDLEQVFDSVIIDAPPLLPVTDAAVLSQHVGGVMMVVGARRIKHHDLEKSLRALELVDANVLGAVLNLLPTKGPDAYAYSYYTKSGEPQRKTRSSAISVTPNETSSKMSAPEGWEPRAESRRASKFPQQLSE